MTKLRPFRPPNNIVERTGPERPSAHDERWAFRRERENYRGTL
jgi:hypothetical protein